LRVTGPDQTGIVAACTQILGRYGCSITNSEQWVDRNHEKFFQRIAFEYDNHDAIIADAASIDKVACQQEIDDVCDRMGLEPILNWRDRKPKVGIMVSKYDRCLWELLLRHSAHELDMDIEVIISNHETLRHVADTFDLPYHVLPVTAQNKQEQEAKQLELLKDVDVVVLARYMQVLTDSFLQQFPNRIINIHHSFLPAFSGGSPYQRASERGVKLVGATAHYATVDLDEGPIITQDVLSVTHRDTVPDLMRKGRILEGTVLSKALEAHLEDRVIVYNNRCVVFGD